MHSNADAFLNIFFTDMGEKKPQTLINYYYSLIWDNNIAGKCISQTNMLLPRSPYCTFWVSIHTHPQNLCIDSYRYIPKTSDIGYMEVFHIS